MVVKDPVCNAKVKDTEHQIAYKRKIYYFDCQACKNKFEQDPERFFKKIFLGKIISVCARKSN